MTDFILRARHWLLFIPLFLPTLVNYGAQAFYIGEFQRFQQKLINNSEDIGFVFPDFSAYSSYVLFFILLSVLSYLVVVAWSWSVGQQLREYLPAGTNLDPGRQRVALLLMSLVYLFMFAGIYYLYGWFATNFSGVDTAASEPPAAFTGPEFISKMVVWFSITAIGSLVLLGCTIYNVYFIGKTLRSIELGRPARGGELMGYAVLSFIFIIGVWILQPKINRLVETGSMDKPGDDGVWK